MLLGSSAREKLKITETLVFSGVLLFSLGFSVPSSCQFYDTKAQCTNCFACVYLGACANGCRLIQ